MILNYFVRNICLILNVKILSIKIHQVFSGLVWQNLNKFLHFYKTYIFPEVQPGIRNKQCWQWPSKLAFWTVFICVSIEELFDRELFVSSFMQMCYPELGSHLKNILFASPDGLFFWMKKHQNLGRRIRKFQY